MSLPSSSSSAPSVPPTRQAAPVATREALVAALEEAAVLEHSVTCQYLFTAFTFKRAPSEGVSWVQLEAMRAWQATILLVARQEMEHLGMVCNLMTAIGASPCFGRPAFPHAAAYTPGVAWARLQRFGEAALQDFMAVEKAHGLRTAAGDGSGATIGDLYGRIRSGFEHLDRTLPSLFIGPREGQVTNETIDLPRGWYDVDMLGVADLESARRAIDHIVEAGDAEAGDAPPHAQPDSHYRRFAEIRQALCAMRRDDPAFEPARPVAPNPLLEAHPGAAAGAVTVIQDPTTRLAAQLFNEAYEVMLLMLLRFYAPVRETAAERQGLRRLAFFPLMTMVLRPLGELLTRMPVREGDTLRAGPGFEIAHTLHLHPHKNSAWIILHERLVHMEALCGRLCREAEERGDEWRGLLPRLAFLRDNLETMSGNFERHMGLTHTHLRHFFKNMR